MRRARSRLLAFTLLEVLAAVAILALVYTVLARVGIQGFRAEGGADRRLRASLMADDLLAEIEGQLATGSAPPIGEKDGARDEYLIHLRVTPAAELEIPARSEAATQRMQAANAKKSASGTAAAAKAAAGPTLSLLQPQAKGEPPPGRHIELRVSWTEGTTESAVVRETYGLDQSAAPDIFLALASASKAQGNGGPESKAPATPPQAGPPAGGTPATTGGAGGPGMGSTP